MILDSLENAEQYYAMSPYFKKAFEFLKAANPEELEGKIDIEGEKIYAMVIKSKGTGHEGAELEIHKKYIDIQFGVDGVNEFGWKPTQECVTVTKAFDDEDDFGYFAEEPDLWITVQPGQYAIFFPGDAHTPKGGTGNLHKLLVKIAVD